MAKNESQFTNFKIHSQFSICEGAVKIDELANIVKKIKLKQLVCAIVIIYVVL